MLLAKEPDEYYGWTEDEGWIGADAEREAQVAVACAENVLDSRQRFLAVTATDDPKYADRSIACVHAQEALAAAQQALAEVQDENALVLKEYQNDMVERVARGLFKRYFRLARLYPLDLYHTGIPGWLRDYIQRQMARGVASPTSLVYVWMIVKDTIRHSEDHQLDAVDAFDYWADIPLACATVDVDEDQATHPTRARREYIRRLQAEGARERQRFQHPNGDRHDALAEWEYHGLPEQLGALWHRPDESCPHCQEPLQLRTRRMRGGYAQVEGCAERCTFNPKTDVYPTKKALREHLRVVAARARAARNPAAA